ncbi:MAG: heavy metal-binding domain-containing protein [Myxococcaceae bacterium]
MASSEIPQMPGDLPVHARERLTQMRERKLFTSDLSVSEFVLVREAGFEPLGMVMGTSICQVPTTIPSHNSAMGCELTHTTDVLYHARERAMTRMEEEADQLGADGIVGVRLTVNLAMNPQRRQWQAYRQWAAWSKSNGFARPPGVIPAGYFPTWPTIAQQQWVHYCQQQGWVQLPLAPWQQPGGPVSYQLGPNTAEFLAIGTAVRHREGGNFRNKKGKPFQSDLSGQDFWLLIRSGYRPVGFVMGNCVYYVNPKMVNASGWKSGELVNYTHALYDARELAIERLQDEAEELGATGIVGVTVAERSHSYRANPWNVGNAALQSGEVLEMFVFGTAVVPTGEKSHAGHAALVLSANEVEASKVEGAEE